jgi:hypothetical protein
MFNLEQAIADWRRRLVIGGIQSAAILDELESHLRDDLEEQVRSGIDPRQAFETASRRLGPVATLRQEFMKAGELHSTWQRSFLHGLYWVGAAIVLLMDTWILTTFDMRAAERLTGVCVAAGIALGLGGVPFWRRRGAAVPGKHLLGGVKMAASLACLWPIWELLTALHVIRVETGMFPTMVLWSLCAALMLIVIGFIPPDGRTGESSAGGPGGGCPQPSPLLPVQTGPGGSLNFPATEGFTELARESLTMACDEARRLGHDYVGTEHVLLGVLRNSQGAVVRRLKKSRLDVGAVRREIERLISPAPQSTTRALRLTPRAQKALKIARRQAKSLKHPLIEADDIVAGLLLEGSGVAALALRNLGVRV